MSKPGFLAGPFEILELRDSEKVRLAIVGYEFGKMEISPRYPGAPEKKEIQALRLNTAPGIKKAGPAYYDVTSQTLIAQLRPFLDVLAKTQAAFEITAYGSGPRKRFTLEM